MAGERTLLSLAGAAMLLACTGAAAQTALDPKTGLSVTPPPGYQASNSPARGRYSAVIDVKRSGERDTGCKVAFQPMRQDLTQAQMNQMVDAPERRAVIENSLGMLYRVQSVETFEHAGVKGSAATASFKQLPGLPAQSAEMISLFYLLETPAGRTTTVCLSHQSKFAERKPEFEAVMRSLKLP
jgi:hypothetical protein